MTMSTARMLLPLFQGIKKMMCDWTKPQNDIGVSQYLEALEIRKICHEMVALLGGKMPHVQGIVGRRYHGNPHP